MRKKLTYLFIIALFIILPVLSVKADLNCIYKYYDSSNFLYLKVVFSSDDDRDFPYYGTANSVGYLDAGEEVNFEPLHDDVMVLFNNECPKSIVHNYGNVAENHYIVSLEMYNSGEFVKITNGVGFSSSSYHGELYKSYDDDFLNKVYCGSEEKGRITNIPKKLPELTSSAFTIIQIAVPIILVLLGSLDLFKGITAGKEDEIKKGQQMFVKRLGVAAVIFLIVVIVKFFISVVADTNSNNIIDCIDCFVSGNCMDMKAVIYER